MKRILFSSWLVIFLLVNLSSQNPKRYIFLEHFTNTVCGICATKNPPLFDKIAQYQNDIHHISIHPPVPYTTCEFYNENTFENEALAIPYGINGTPKLYMWGNFVSTNILLPDAALQDAFNQTSPISVIVSESGTTQRNVEVDITAYEDLPNGNDYRLFVAMVERNVNYNAPNGESVHHNVFRKLLTPETGVPIDVLASGESYNFESVFDVSPNYVEEEIYAIAWVQIFETKEIVNSGASYDMIINSNENKFVEASVFIYPNPTSELLNIDAGEINIEKILVRNIDGKISMEINELSNNKSIDISHLSSGVYFVSIFTTDGISTKKITKL